MFLAVRFHIFLMLYFLKFLLEVHIRQNRSAGIEIWLKDLLHLVASDPLLAPPDGGSTSFVLI